MRASGSTDAGSRGNAELKPPAEGEERLKVWMDPDLLMSRHIRTGEPMTVPGYDEKKRKWKGLWREHGKLMSELIDSRSAASCVSDAPFDDEITPRLRVSLASDHSSLPRARDGWPDLTQHSVHRPQAHYAHFRRILEEDYLSEEDEIFFPKIVRNKEQLLIEVSAMFEAVYENSKHSAASGNVEQSRPSGLQLPWRIAGPELCELKFLRASQRRGSSSSSSFVYDPASLRILTNGTGTAF